MYMTVGNFRKELKNCFDAALHGDKVEIERGGVAYSLTAVGIVGTVVQAPKINYSVNVPSNIQTPVGVVTPKAEIFHKLKESIGIAADAVKLCKIHGIPLDDRGRCMQKGCRYA